MGSGRANVNLCDDSGYVVNQGDLDFLRLSDQDIDGMLRMRHPLGTSESSFKYFVGSLSEALEMSAAGRCDVRIQGSAAKFFSGQHKAMPWSRDEVLDAFERLRARLPQDFELDQLLQDLEALWPTAAPRPRRRMFDLLFRLGLDAQPSDIDVQISSDELFNRAEEAYVKLGVTPLKFRVSSRQYGFVNKHIIRAVAPALDLWASDQSAIHGRLVAHAVFSGNGPDKHETAVSSHFLPGDWILSLEKVGTE